jgi:hypothetical protein
MTSPRHRGRGRASTAKGQVGVACENKAERIKAAWHDSAFFAGIRSGARDPSCRVAAQDRLRRSVGQVIGASCVSKRQGACRRWHVGAKYCGDWLRRRSDRRPLQNLASGTDYGLTAGTTMSGPRKLLRLFFRCQTTHSNEPRLYAEAERELNCDETKRPK